MSRTEQPATDAALSMAVPLRADTVAGRILAVLVADGVDSVEIDAMRSAFEAHGGVIKIIAPNIGFVTDATRDTVAVDHSFATVGSVLFDAAYIPGGLSATTLCNNPHAVLFVKEAYKHGKAIALSGEGMALLKKAAISAGLANGKFAGPGIVVANGKNAHAGFARNVAAAVAEHRFPTREDIDLIVA